jgi:hypothetical protein
MLSLTFLSGSLICAFITASIAATILWSLSITSGLAAVFNWWFLIYYPLLETNNKQLHITTMLSTFIAVGLAILAFNF